MIDYKAIFDVVEPINFTYGSIFTVGIINGIIKSDLMNSEKVDAIEDVLRAFRKDGKEYE